RYPPDSPLFPYTTLFRSFRKETTRKACSLRNRGNWYSQMMSKPISASLLIGFTCLFAVAVHARELTLNEALARVESDSLEVLIRDRKSTRLNSSHVKISY